MTLEVFSLVTDAIVALGCPRGLIVVFLLVSRPSYNCIEQLLNPYHEVLFWCGSESEAQGSGY